MARLWSCGFELQSATAAMEWDTSTGTPGISTAVFRSGAAALRCNPTAATRYIQHDYADSTTIKFARVYVRIASAPAAITDILALGDNANSYTARIRMNANRTLELWSDTAQVGSDSAALAVDTWYRIELSYNDATGDAVVGRIDGVDFASGTGGDNGGNGRVRCGVITSTTADLYFDDLAINDSSGAAQTSWPGAGSIVHMYPNGAGDNNNASAGTFADVDDKPTPDDGTTFAVLDANNDILDVAMESSATAGIASGDTITLVHANIREASATGTAAQSKAPRIKSASGGTTTQGTTYAHNDVTYRTNGDTVLRVPQLTSYVDPTTGVAWTPTGTNSLDNMQIGVIAIDADPDIRVTALWALVEYVPNPNITLVVADMTFALAFEAPALTQKHSLAVADMAFALGFESPTIVYDLMLVVADMTFGLAFETPTLTQKHTLAIADMLFGLGFENVALTQKHTLAVADMLFALGFENVVLVQDQLLEVADMLFALSVESPTLTQKHNLTVQDMAFALLFDNLTLTQKHLLAVADMLFAQAYDNAVLTQSQILAVQDMLFALTFDNAVLTQKHTLAVADMAFGLSFENVTITQKHLLAIADMLFGLSFENAVLTQSQFLAVQDMLFALSYDNVALTQKHTLVTQDMLFALAFDAPTLLQKHLLSVADMFFNLDFELVELPTAQMLEVQDMLFSLALDPAPITQKHLLQNVADLLFSLSIDPLVIREVLRGIKIATDDGTVTAQSDDGTLNSQVDDGTANAPVSGEVIVKVEGGEV